MLQLPAMIQDAVDKAQSTSSCTAHDAQVKDTSLNKQLSQIDEVRKTQNVLIKKIEGYKTQAAKWFDIRQKIEETVLPHFKERIETLEKSWSTKEKSLSNKTKNYLFIHTKMSEQLEEINEIKKKLKEHLKCTDDAAKNISDIDKSQKYVSAEYDEIKAMQEKQENEMKNIRKKLERQEMKNEQTANYSRLECLEFGGVPRVLDIKGNENCKWQIIEICKELNYWIPEHTISTAHRKKQHHSKTGPAPIIVKFNCKDIRNDVFKLRHQLKENINWRCFNINRLFINESLTPDANKLFYATRIFTKEMHRVHGKIYTWTFKGEIFIRKGVDGAPKRKISCLDDLTKIRSGTVSIEPPVIVTDSTIRTNEHRIADVITTMSNLNI